MKILFVLNPKAGGTDKTEIIHLFEEKSKAHQFEFKILHTTGENDQEKIEYEIKAYNPDKIAIGGGDGTVRDVCSVLVKNSLKTAIGIIPTGSANGLATCLGLPNDVETNIEGLTTNKYKDIDSLYINNEHLCIHLFDLGVNANIVKRYSEEKSRGMLGYGKHLLEAINNSERFEFEIESPEKNFKSKGHMLIGANGHQYGTGVVISNGAMDDGRFEIKTIGEISLIEAIKSGLTIFNVFVDDKILNDCSQHSEAKLKIKPAAPLQIDGEYIDEVSQLNIKLNPASIRIIIPHEET